MGGNNSKPKVASPKQNRRASKTSSEAPANMSPQRVTSVSDPTYQIMSFKKRRGAVKKGFRGIMKLMMSVDGPKEAESTLNISIDSAKDLATTTASADSYVKLEIMPELPGCSAVKSSVIKGTKSPKFKEDFQFKIKSKKLDLSTYRLVINIRNNKPDGRTEMVGAFSFGLDELFDPEIDGWPKGGIIDAWFKIFDAQKGKSLHMEHVKGQRNQSAGIEFKIGDSVWVEGKGPGKVAFVGKHHENGKDRIGVILTTPMGNGNGTFKGHKYFECADQYGVLLPPINKKGKQTVTHDESIADGADDGMYADTEKFEGVVQVPVKDETIKKEKKKLKESDFRYLTVLGRGSFGKVMLAEKPGSTELFAVKVLKKTRIIDDDDVGGTMIEKRTLELSEGCSFITKLHGTFQTDANLFFVMEFVNGGDLMYHLMNLHRFTTAMSRFLSAEILIALWYLHDNGVIYRDLKLDNVLMTQTGHIKLADFGLSKENVFGAAQTTTFCGTPTYLAPEIISEQPYGHSVDFWSLGVLVHEFIVGESPFESPDDNELFRQVLTKKISIPKSVDKDAATFATALLQRDPSHRLGAKGRKDFESHPFLKSVDWKKMEKMQVKPPFVPKIKNPRDAECFDAEFTNEKPKVSPPNKKKLAEIDPNEFNGFSFINPTGVFGNRKRGTTIKKRTNQSDLRHFDWYKPELSRKDVQEKLTGKPIGTFCIRESKTQPGSYALSVAVKSVPGEAPTYAGLITPYPDGKGGMRYALMSKIRFHSIPDLVDYYKLHPIPHGDLSTMLSAALK